jgi:hypothetical protein
MAIVDIWLKAAQGIMGAWAGAFSTVGFPPAAAIMAGIMTGLITTMAGVQTGLVAAQQFKGEQGGVIGAGSMSGDNVMLNANKGEALIPNADFRLLVDQIRSGRMSGGNMSVHIGQVVSNDPKDFVNKLIEIRRYEAAR